MKLILQKPDTFGAIASTLCIIHCVATPFLFVVHSCTLSGCESTPSWWKNLDYFFLTISFMAIYHSTKTTSKNFMKIALFGKLDGFISCNSKRKITMDFIT